MIAVAIGAARLTLALARAVTSTVTSEAFLLLVFVWAVWPKVPGPGEAVMTLRQTQTV